LSSCLASVLQGKKLNELKKEMRKFSLERNICGDGKATERVIKFIENTAKKTGKIELKTK